MTIALVFVILAVVRCVYSVLRFSGVLKSPCVFEFGIPVMWLIAYMLEMSLELSIRVSNGKRGSWTLNTLSTLSTLNALNALNALIVFGFLSIMLNVVLELYFYWVAPQKMVDDLKSTEEVQGVQGIQVEE